MIAALNIWHLAWLGWGLANAALLAGIGTALTHDERALHPVPELPAAAPVESVAYPDFRLRAREKTFAATLKRPLFVPSRAEAPPVPPPPPPPPPSMKKGQFQLLGTLITDEGKIAVVREIVSGKERQVYEGYTINGLLLELVEPTRIVFTQYDDREELQLKTLRSPKPATPPAAAPAGKAPPTAAGGAAASVAPAAPARAAPPAGWVQRPGTSEAPASRPIQPPAPPQTMEDRMRNPLMKDFYK
ncbi:hypothetical protein [Diaphorobacter sp.]|uniref:hypothetical protein n=1 Tax=Diaphorobacter sp. TaxID=1934310 RepID=UPI0025829D13|nr:hypothetical protein [Diaphorobacter sp.]